MPSNIEIKAHYDDPKRLEQSMSNVLGKLVDTLIQEDTFYNCCHGRLKLRQETLGNGSSAACLIGYHRNNNAGPKKSNFTTTTIPNPTELNQILATTLGIKLVVKKSRQLYLVKDIGDTELISRVHVDKVDGLGNFIELEVQLEKDSIDADGIKFANKLIEKLQIKKEELIEDAYADMLERLMNPTK